MIATTLSKIPFSYVYTKDWKTIGYYKPEVVLQHPLTVQEQIWTLFRIPTDICYQEIGMKDNQNWMHIFKWLIEEKTIDRLRVLKEILSALVNTNFNKTQLVWFGDIFKLLNPTEEELLAMQSDLFAAIYTPQSKPLSMLIDYQKQICLHTDFMVEEFYLSLPVLLNSGTKSILKSSISLAEILLKNKKGEALEICQALCQGFLTKDEAIQKQIAKIITKYSKPDEIADTINSYYDSILSTVRSVLVDYIDTENTPEDVCKNVVDEVVDPVKHISEETKLPQITTWEDFVFYAPQVFERKAVSDFYLLPAYIIRFDKEMTGERALQLLPFFKKAVKAADGWQSLFICNILASFVISYSKLLADRYPEIKEEFKDILSSDHGIVNAVTYLRESLNVVNSAYQQGLYLNRIIEAIRTKEDLKLLCIPTHSPAWIDPCVLVERLQNTGGDIWEMDMEMALQKCCLEDSGEAIRIADKLPDGEIKDLLLFLFDKNRAFESSKVKHKNRWITTYLTKYPNTPPPADIKKVLDIETVPYILWLGELKWQFEEKLHLGEYSYPFGGDEHVKFIAEYDFFARQSKNYFQEFRDEDIAYFICNNPYNHGIALMKGLQLIVNFKGTLNLSERTVLSRGLNTVHELNLPYTEVDYLFLSFSLCCSGKEIKDLAMEIWMSGALKTIIHNEQLGIIFATMINKSDLPLSRFTELVMNQIQYNSASRNLFLEEMLNACLINLERKPKDLKKLLLVYQEILNVNNSKPTDAVCLKLQQWVAIPSAKKVCGELIK